MDRSEPSPSLFQGLVDHLCVALQGGVRVRVLRGGKEPTGRALGRRGARPKPERLLRIVLELEPDGPGIVRVWQAARGGYRVRASGAMARGGFEQRLRNVLSTLSAPGPRR